MSSGRPEDGNDFHDAPMNGSSSSNLHIQETSFDSNGGSGADNESFDEEMSDIPIDTADHGSSLPSAEELRSALPSQQQKKSCRYLLIAIVAALMVVALLSIGAGVSNKNKQQESGSSSNVQDPPPRQASLSQVIKFLSATGISSTESLQQGGSPQSMAANWMANLDAMNMALPNLDDGMSTDEGYKYVTRYVLGLLWYGMEGESWLNKFGFLSSNEICYWNSFLPVTNDGNSDFEPRGVYCNKETRKVMQIHMDYNNLKGTFPSELTALTSLELLVLSGNDMRGNLESSICKLTSLTSLSLFSAGLLGTLPSCLSSLTDLSTLILSNNYFNSKLPDFTKLTKLASVLLDDNEFSDDITSTFNSMPELKWLILQNNDFEAKLDDKFLKNAANLQRIDMSNCKLTGQLPSHLFDLPNLELMDLHGNRLSGTIPSELKVNTKLEFLSLHENLIKGQLHPSLMNLTALFHLDVSNNTITGKIPGRIGMLDLHYLFLANNNFTKGTIPSLIGRMNNLTELSLKGTNRNGTIPRWLGRNLTQLELLDLDNNHLTGKIPVELGYLENLRFLLLNRNQGIKGTIPSQMNKLSSLRSVFLDGTALDGDLAPLCKLPNLNTPENSGQTTRKYVIADCGGNNPKVSCKCCDQCCSNANPLCNKNYEIASIDPNWESKFARVEYSFGTNASRFEDRVSVPNP